MSNQFRSSFTLFCLASFIGFNSQVKANFVLATHVPARGPDAVLAVGGTVNTVAADDPLFDWDGTAAGVDTNGQWRWRPGIQGLANEGWHETDVSFPFPNDGMPPDDIDAPMLVTTMTGLTVGQAYEVYVDYLAEIRTTSAGKVNWTILAGLSPSTLDAYGTIDGYQMGSYTTIGLGDPRVFDLGVDDGNIHNYRAFLGMQNADSNGEIKVYIDDTDNMSLAVSGDLTMGTAGSNGRAAYDGVAFFEFTVVFPTIVIDRDTGSISFKNNDPGPISLLGYSITSSNGDLDASNWTSIANNYDADSGSGPTQVDSDDNWTLLTTTTEKTDLSEFQFGGPGPNNGATLLNGNSISLGTGAWIANPFESNVEASYTDENGSTFPINVEFVGNGGKPFEKGDFDTDGDIDSDDYAILLSNFNAGDLTGSTTEKYLMGNLNTDSKVTIADAIQFSALYDAANGTGSFANMIAGVPEPSTYWLFAIVGSSFFLVVAAKNPKHLALALSRSKLGMLLIVGCLLTLIVNSAYAAPLILSQSDPNGFAFHGRYTTEKDGFYEILNEDLGGTTLNDTVYFAPNPGFEGSTMWIAGQILGETEVDTTLGDGLQSYAEYTVRFNTEGTYRVFWSGQRTATPSAVAEGNTAGGTDSVWVGPLNQDHTATTWPPFHVIQPGGISYRDTAVDWVIDSNNVNTDLTFTLGLREDGCVYDRVAFVLLDGSNMPVVDPEVLDASTIPILNLVLEINEDTGMVRILNNSGKTIDMKYYEVMSDSGSLDYSNWNSLDAQNFDAMDGNDPDTVAGDTPGEGWDVTGGSINNNSFLSEYKLQGVTTIANGDELSLGKAFNEVSGLTSGLQFNVGFADGLVVPGIVSIVNGTAESADFDGDVDDLDLATWRSQYGSGNGSGSLANAAVPEPVSILIFLVAAITVACMKRNSFT